MDRYIGMVYMILLAGAHRACCDLCRKGVTRIGATYEGRHKTHDATGTALSETYLISRSLAYESIASSEHWVEQ